MTNKIPTGSRHWLSNNYTSAGALHVEILEKPYREVVALFRRHLDQIDIPVPPGGYDPWYHLLRSGAPASYVQRAELGHSGLTTFAGLSIQMDSKMGWAEERSILAHELVHVDLGPIGIRVQDWMTDEDLADVAEVVFKAENAVDEIAAARLLPDRRSVATACAQMRTKQAAADVLGVDRGLLEARLRSMGLSETLAEYHRPRIAAPHAQRRLRVVADLEV